MTQNTLLRPEGLVRSPAVRLTWQPRDWTHDTTLQLTVSPVGEGRSRLGVHQERLADAAERERQRRHWKGVVAALVEALTAG